MTSPIAAPSHPHATGVAVYLALFIINLLKTEILKKGSADSEGYTKINDSRRELKVHRTKKNWAEARRVCQSEGGDLAIDDSPAIHDYLSTKEGSLWIGASRLTSVSYWVV